MNVFLSYAVGPGDGPIAARLRAVAAAYELTIVLPDRTQMLHNSLAIETLTKINESDAVIALVTKTAPFDEINAVKLELTAASLAAKPIVGLIEQGMASPYAASGSMVYFDRRNPNAHETSLMQALHQLRNQQQWKKDLTALGWIAGIALGLVALNEVLASER